MDVRNSKQKTHKEERHVEHLFIECCPIMSKARASAAACSIALWVKSGNRGNLKCLNLNDHYELIFDRKMFISFLSDAKLLHVYD